MPVPPRPLTFSCPCCGWQATTIPLSDCLAIGIDCHVICPKCRHTELDTRPATRQEVMKKRLSDFLRPCNP